jgi:hypothetical protein
VELFDERYYVNAYVLDISMEEPTVLNGNSIYPDPELERDVYEGPPLTRGGIAAGNQEPDIMEMIRLMQGGAAPNDPNFSANPPQQQKPETPFSKFIKSPLPIMAIAIITYSLFIFQFHHVMNAVFSIFIAWEILVFTLTAFLYPESNSLSGILNFLPLFFPRLNSKILQMALKIFLFFNKAFRDLAIFVFTFVMFHIAYSYIIAGESLSRILDKDMNNVLTS